MKLSTPFPADRMTPLSILGDCGISLTTSLEFHVFDKSIFMLLLTFKVVIKNNETLIFFQQKTRLDHLQRPILVSSATDAIQGTRIHLRQRIRVTPVLSHQSTPLQQQQQ